MTEIQEKVLISEERAFTLYRLEGRILFFDYRDNILVELEDVKRAFDLYVEYSEGYTCKVLIVFGKFATIDVEARKYNENKSMPTPALAVVLHNLAQRMIGRFYQLLRKDDHPLQFFNNKQDALKWLRQMNSEIPSEGDKSAYN